MLGCFQNDQLSHSFGCTHHRSGGHSFIRGDHHQSFYFIIGSDFNYATASVDARRYFPVTGAHVLALQAYARFSWGDVPFQGMARLGGSNRLRGYFAGRHIDVHMVAAQAEYRLPLYWKIDATVFGGIGDVAGDIGKLDPLDLKYAGGFGLRYVLNAKDRVKLRFDFALTGDSDFGFYISLGEAF